MPAIPPPSPNPCAEKGRRLLESFDQLKVLTPVDEHDPLPGLKRRIELLAEEIELLRDIQAIRPGEPIDRVIQSTERLLEANRWAAINYTDHTEETQAASDTEMANFEATKLSDEEWKEFWRHIGAPLPATPLAQARGTPAEFNKGVERRCRYEDKFDVGSLTKDALENRLGALVRSGQMSIEDAARAQSDDWIASYEKYVSPELPPWRGQYLDESE